MINQICSERKAKRNLGTSNRWPHVVPKTCVQGGLEDVLRTSWGRPESTSLVRPLDVRLGRPLDVISKRPQDVSLGRLRDGQIVSLGDVLGTLEGDVLGTNICRLGGTKKVGRNPSYCFFLSCFTVSVMLSINTFESSNDVTILIISFISSFEINKVSHFPALAAPFPFIFL